MDGKVVLITGSTSGLGLETARQLYSRGATVILTCRDEVKGRAAVDSVQQAGSKTDREGGIHLYSLDLMSYNSILEFSSEIRNHFEKIDVLVCNAGVMGLPFELSSDGIEAHFATNQFGHFVLVNRLLSLLEAARGRIVIVSSGLYKNADHIPSLRQLMGEISWDYDSRFCYSFSKLANCLYAAELARRLDNRHSPVKVFALRPGFVRGTELGRQTNWILRKLAVPIIWMFSKSLEDGVDTIVHCSSVNSEELTSGSFYSNCQEEEYGSMVDQHRMNVLWEICCHMEDLILKRSSKLTESEKGEAKQLRIS